MPSQGLDRHGSLHGAPGWRLLGEGDAGPAAAGLSDGLAAALGAGGWTEAGASGPASLVILSATAAPDGLGAHVAGESAPAWLAKPQRRGFLAPRRETARVTLTVLGADGALIAQASAWQRVRPGEAAARQAALLDRATAALLALRAPG